MFSVCDLVLINKTDVAPYFDFDFDRCEANIKKRNPRAQVIRICARTGEGIDRFADWILSRTEKHKEEKDHAGNE